MDKNDLSALLKGASPEEVDRIHRLLHEWSAGPEDSYPVQLALLTRAQWRMAASVPRSLDDSRTWLELHLAEYRQHCRKASDDVVKSLTEQNRALRNTVEMHTQFTRQATEEIQRQLDDAEAVARHVKSLMEKATKEWEGIKASTAAECERLRQISSDLQNRFAWRVILHTALWFLLVIGFGIFIGHYWIR
jgi:myosin heavy subunit